MRNLDLVVLLSFSASLWFFNRGDIFTAVPLAYPPMAYLLARMVWSAWRGGPERGRRCGRSGCSPRRRSSSPGSASG
jgi:hypothetical protein